MRVDLFPEVLAELEDPEFRITIGGAEEITVVVKVERGRVKELAVENKKIALVNAAEIVEAGFEKILEVAIRREALNISGLTSLRLGVALWHGGLPVDVLPASGYLEVSLGEEHGAWGLQEKVLGD